MPATGIMDPVEVQVPPVLAVSVQGSSGGGPAEIGPAMERTFDALMDGLGTARLDPAGPLRTIYTWATEAETRFLVAFPLAAPPEAPVEEPLAVGELDGGRFLRFEHLGPYDHLMAKYEEITSWMLEKGLMESRTDWDRYMPMWEEYVNDPETTPPEELLTYIYLPHP